MTKEQEESLAKQALCQGLTIPPVLLNRVKEVETVLETQGTKVSRFVLDCEGDAISLYFFKDPEGYACIVCYEETCVFSLPNITCYECPANSKEFLQGCAAIKEFLLVGQESNLRSRSTWFTARPI